MNFLNIDRASVNSAVIPNVFVDDVVLDKADEGQINVHATLSLKHVSVGKRPPPWESRPIGIRAILVSDRGVYNRLVRAATGRISKFIFNDIGIHKILNDKCQVLHVCPGDKLKTLKRGDYQTYPLGSSGQEEMVNIPFQIKFDPMASLDTGHLSLFVYSYVEFKGTSSSATEHQNTNIITAAASVGNVRIKPIIQNSKVVQESYLLRRSDNNEIYLGGFHSMGNGVIMSGAKHTDTSVSLTKEKVPDLSIKDYRNLSHYGDLITNLTIPKNVFVPELNKTFVREVKKNLDDKNKTAWFSDIWISRSQFGDCNFTFSIDFKKIVLENTKFSKLLEIYPQLINTHFNVLSLKIWRQRIENPKPIGFQNINETVFFGFESSAFDRGPYGNSIGAKLDGSVTEKELIIISRNLNKNITNAAQNSMRKLSLRGSEKSGIIMLAVKDHSVSQETAGLYRYEVELEIEDNLDSFIQKKADRMNGPLKAMEDYYAIASQQQIQNNKKLNSSSGTKNYDPVSRKFSKEFVKEMDRKYNKVYDTPWWHAAEVIVDAVKMLSVGNAKALTKTFLVQMCDPRTATVESIKSVILLMQKLKTELSRLVDPAPEPLTDQSKGTAPKNKLSGHSSGLASAEPIKDMVKISHIFSNDCFDASVVNHVGYDFLLRKDQGFDDIGQTSTLRTLDAAEFRDRVRQEQEKYFTGKTTPSVTGLSQQIRSFLNLSLYEFSFLSPSRVRVRDKLDLSFLCLGLPVGEKYPFKKLAHAASEIKIARLIPGYPLTQAPATTAAGSIEKGSSNPKSDLPTNQNQAIRQAISKNLVNILDNKNCTVEKYVRAEKSRPEGKEVTKEFSKNLSFKTFFSDTSTLRNQIGGLNPFEEQGFRKIFGVDSTTEKEEFECDKVFLALLYNFILVDQEHCGGGTNINPRSTTSFERFDLDNEDNFLNCIPTSSQTTTESSLSPVGLSKLPNQIKALFLSFASDFINFVNFSVFQDKGDVLKDPLKAYTYFFNFFHLVRIEVFDGFEMTTMPTFSKNMSGVPSKSLMQKQSIEFNRSLSVRMPKWKLLTKKEFDNSVINGHELLCRASYYENSTLGVKSPPGLRLPIFDKYFLVKPPTYQRPGASTPVSSGANDGPVVNLDRVLSQIKPEFLVSSAMIDEAPTASGQASTTRAATATTSMTRGAGTGGGY